MKGETMPDKEREPVDRFVEAYSNLLEENRQMNARRIEMLKKIEEQRILIWELQGKLKELNNGRAHG